MLLGIIRAEQSRLSGVESTAVSQANETAAQAAAQASSVAESVAAAAVANSTSDQVKNIGSSSAQSSSSATNVFSSAASSFSGTGLRGPNVRSSGIENQTVETVSIASIDFTGRSPIKDYLDEKRTVNQDNIQPSQRPPEVKRNVPDNEAAGGVTIAALAKQPPGFELYQMALRDSPFYAPKEIYKNQKVIDNQRVLRQLNGRSDRIHQEMVDEQYKNR